MRRTNMLDQEAQDWVESAAQTLAAQSDLALGISQVLAETNRFLHTEAVSIFLVDPANQELVLRYAASPDSEEVVGLCIPPGQGVVGWVVRYGEDLIVPSTAMDPRFFSGVDKETGFVTRSILCAPIVSGGRTLGAIEALNKTTGHFNDADVLLLQEIASVIAGYLA